MIFQQATKFKIIEWAIDCFLDCFYSNFLTTPDIPKEGDTFSKIIFEVPGLMVNVYTKCKIAEITHFKATEKCMAWTQVRFFAQDSRRPHMMNMKYLRFIK